MTVTRRLAAILAADRDAPHCLQLINQLLSIEEIARV